MKIKTKIRLKIILATLIFEGRNTTIATMAEEVLSDPQKIAELQFEFRPLKQAYTAFIPSAEFGKEDCLIFVVEGDNTIAQEGSCFKLEDIPVVNSAELFLIHKINIPSHSFSVSALIQSPIVSKNCLKALTMLKQIHNLARQSNSTDIILEGIKARTNGNNQYIFITFAPLRLWGLSTTNFAASDTDMKAFSSAGISQIEEIFTTIFNTMENILNRRPDIMQKFRNSHVHYEKQIPLSNPLKADLIKINPSLDAIFNALSLSADFSKSLVDAVTEVLKAQNRLEDGRCDDSWAVHIEKIMKHLSIQDLGDKVFYIDGEGVVEESKQVFKKLNKKDNRYTEHNLLNKLKDGHTILQAWFTKKDGAWEFVARLQEPKQEKVIVTEKSPEPQIIPSSSSSSSQGPVIETQEQVLAKEKHLLSIENEAPKVTVEYRLNRVKDNEIKIRKMEDKIFVTKGDQHCPEHTGFIQQVLKGEEVTLGKSESNYVYKQMLDFAESIKKHFPNITVHYPRQCSGSQKVYLVSDKKSHIYFVCLPKKGESYVMR